VLRRCVLFAFRLLYYELAFTYDLVAWTVSVGQWRAWQRTALPLLRGQRVLEVGHGTGNLLLDLAGGFRPVGLDLSPRMGAIARRKLRRARAGPGLRVALVRGASTPCPLPAARSTAWSPPSQPTTSPGRPPSRSSTGCCGRAACW
jgi:ubiquinone/menaquinone biosynthesis C-methylase UbiE